MSGTITLRNAIPAIPVAISLVNTLPAVAVNRPACRCFIDSLACGAFAMLGLAVTQAVQLAAVERL
jgi:hypothetical protein